VNGSGFDWRRFLALTAAGLVGVFAVVPYQLAAIKIPEVQLTDVLLQVLVVNAPLVAAAVAVGTALAHRVGLRVRAPEVEMRDYAIAAGAGFAVAAAIVALDVAVFQPLLQNAASGSDLTEVFAPVWTRLLAGLYGGVTEELLLRYGLLTLLFWTGTKVETAVDAWSRPTTAWAAILLTALAFGAAHLPATAATFELTPLVVFRALVLNGLAGVLFGWLYWQRDLLAAMVAHFAADVVVVVLAPLLL
jgi:membrane protease YdiL (CAAX protease family)